FAVVPRTKTWFTALGGATLVVYLFHGFFVLGAEFAGFPGWATDHMPLAWVLITVAAVLLALSLAWAPVSTKLNMLVDPVGAIARRRRTRPGRGPTSG
ncbi:MAG: acyltransferase 3, partial [Marmoricola sp.]|nr:acyltransferase 3 [Marmoricola sp.]